MEASTLTLCNFLNWNGDPEPHVFHLILVKGMLHSLKKVWSQKEMCGALQIQLIPCSWGSSEVGEQERRNSLFIALG